MKSSHELAKRLLEMPDCEITILDGFNGGGNPRTINLGPRLTNIDEYNYDTDDIETKRGNIIVMGYGFY